MSQRTTSSGSSPHLAEIDSTPGSNIAAYARRSLQWPVPSCTRSVSISSKNTPGPRRHTYTCRALSWDGARSTIQRRTRAFVVEKLTAGFHSSAICPRSDFTNWSAKSFPGSPQCPGTHCSLISVRQGQVCAKDSRSPGMRADSTDKLSMNINTGPAISGWPTLPTARLRARCKSSPYHQQNSSRLDANQRLRSPP